MYQQVKEILSTMLHIVCNARLHITISFYWSQLMLTISQLHAFPLPTDIAKAALRWGLGWVTCFHYSEVIMGAMASQITGISIVYSTVCSGAEQRKRQSCALLASVRGIYREPVEFSHKRLERRKYFHLMTSSFVSFVEKHSVMMLGIFV